MSLAWPGANQPARARKNDALRRGMGLQRLGDILVDPVHHGRGHVEQVAVLSFAARKRYADLLERLGK